MNSRIPAATLPFDISIGDWDAKATNGAQSERPEAFALLGREQRKLFSDIGGNENLEWNFRFNPGDRPRRAFGLLGWGGCRLCGYDLRRGL
jgi:hypothetical protein